MRNNPVTKPGAFAGIIAGVATVVVFSLPKGTFVTLASLLPSGLVDINVGFFALIVNVIVTGLVSLATRPAPVATIGRA
jgi:solute:Na+ symporter, SSS family